MRVVERTPLLVSLGAAGIGVLLLVGEIHAYGPLYRREATALALTTLFPATGVVVWLLGVGPWPEVNFGVPLLLFHVVLDAYARWVLIPKMEAAGDEAFERYHGRSVALNGVTMLVVAGALLAAQF